MYLDLIVSYFGGVSIFASLCNLNLCGYLQRNTKAATNVMFISRKEFLKEKVHIKLMNLKS